MVMGGHKPNSFVMSFNIPVCGGENMTLAPLLPNATMTSALMCTVDARPAIVKDQSKATPRDDVLVIRVGFM